MGLFSAKWFDPVIGLDLHLIQPPGPVLPVLVPHPFVGIVFDPLGWAVTMMIAAASARFTGGPFKGPVYINSLPAAHTGTQVKGMPVHVPIGGVFVRPPSNEGTIVTGSKTVHILGASGARFSSMVMTCNDPVNLPTSVVMSIPLGAAVFTGGPTAVDWLAAALAGIRTKWVSDKLHGLFGAEEGSWLSKAICFFTGHPVDVVTGHVFTDHVDFQLAGQIPFKFKRTYCSASTYSGPMGYSWHHSYDQHIWIRKNCILGRLADGRTIRFPEVRPGESWYHPVESLTIARERDAVVLETRGGQSLHFRQIGRSDGAYSLVRIRDLNGNTLSLEYSEGRLSSMVDTCGRLIVFRNDQAGRILAIQAPHPDTPGQQVTLMSFRYNEFGDLVSVTDVLGNVSSYAYNNHMLTKEADRNGLSFYFEYDVYDARGRCVHTWGDGGIYERRLAYYRHAQVTVVEDSVHGITSYFWNESGLVTRVVNAIGSERTYEWDQLMRRVFETDGNGNTTALEYDDHGCMVRVTDREGNATACTYDTNHRLTRIVEASGATLCWQYDEKGNVVAERDPEGGEWRYGREPSGRVMSITDPEGNTHRMLYRTDADGHQIVEHVMPSGNSTMYAYDGWGRMTSIWNSCGRRTEYVYDLLGNLLRKTYPDGCSIVYSWDSERNCLSQNYPDGRSIVYQYTQGNRLRCQTRGAEESIEYEYDTEGRLIVVRNAKKETYCLKRDVLGRLKERIGFDGRVIRYGYDRAGYCTQVFDGDVFVTSIERDRMGRVVRKTVADGELSFFSYDHRGRLLSADNSYRRIRFKRDRVGRVVEEEQGELTIRTEFNASGRRVRRVLRIRNRVSEMQFKYDHLSLLSEISCRYGRVRLIRDIEANIVAYRFPESEYRQGFDVAGRVVEQELLAPLIGRSPIRRQYNYDAAGRLAAKSDERRGEWRYSYDGCDRLVGCMRVNGIQERFDYDHNGNLLHLHNREFYHVEGNRLKEIDSRSCHYDVRGNLLQFTQTAGRTIIAAFNASNRLASVQTIDGGYQTRGGEIAAEYKYDALGRRICKRAAGSETEFFYDQWQLLAESGPGESWAEHSFVPGRGCVVLMSIVNGGARYYLNDHLGTPQEVITPGGEIEWSGEYAAFGRLLQETVTARPFSNPFRFAGQYHDRETGLYFNTYRYYSPDLGQYISQDPIDLFGGLNSYLYATNPTGCVDPTGLNPRVIALGLTKVREDVKGEAFGIPFEGTRERYILDPFAASVPGAETYPKFDRIIDPMEEDIKKGIDWPISIRNAIQEAEAIHFTADGMNNLEDIMADCNPNRFKPGSTSWELATILNDPEKLAAKTTFWNRTNGEAYDTIEELIEKERCG